MRGELRSGSSGIAATPGSKESKVLFAGSHSPRELACRDIPSPIKSNVNSRVYKPRPSTTPLVRTYGHWLIGTPGSIAATWIGADRERQPDFGPETRAYGYAC